MAVSLEQMRDALAGRYRVEREVGAGGMAIVYAAEDLRHGRRVAVKVLRPELAAVIGAERFLQEIKLTAGLQHAHILPLHDSGAVDGLLYYVMPYVEGESLRDKLAREKQLEIPQAIEFARQVASALDYAHRRGIIHRDIKPENILIHDRQALVADFGIALAVSSAGGNRMTETGMSLGTPQYMSPEQAMGDRELDARSDVYSLGAMLYEMLAGDPPYTGSTAQAIVAKVITEKAPPVTVLREMVPGNVAAAIQQALAKLPADRFASAAEFADALANPAFSTPLPTQGQGPAAAPLPGWKRWLWPAAAAAFAGLAGWALLRPGPALRRPVTRYALLFPEEQAPVIRPYPSVALADDGAWFAYVGPVAGERGGNEQLWIKRRESHAPVPVAGTISPRSPVASPDGQWIAYASPAQGGLLLKVPVLGGAPVTLADSLSLNNASGLAWGDDDVITYSDLAWRLRRVGGGGGRAAVAWEPPEGRYALLPTALPGGRGVVFVLCDPLCGQVQELWALDLQSGEAKSLGMGGARAWYVATGHLISLRQDGAAFAAPFDLRTLEITGPAVPVLDSVQTPLGLVPQFAVSRAGAVLYLAGKGVLEASQGAFWVGRDGARQPVDTAWRFESTGNAGWALSPDGRRLAIKLNSEQGQQIWVKQLDAGPYSRLTFDSTQHIRPRWLPDGRTVSYVSNRGASAGQNLYVRRGDGTGPETLRLAMDRPIWEAVWSRDGKWLVLRTGGTAGAIGDRDVFVMQLGVDSMPRPLLVTSADEKAIALSPDGRWLAYESSETGRDEVYVRPFPDVEAGKWQVSINGGVFPLWAHSGRELFYLDVATQMLTAAQVKAQPSFEVAERRPLFSVGPEFVVSGNYTAYDVSPDDRRFLMVALLGGAQAGAASPLVVIENWFEEMRQRFAR